MTYLEDDRVILTKGSIDEVGAKSYDKEANVPGSYVVELQEDLLILGFNAGSADGYFGGHTDEALRAFQEAALGGSRTKDGKALTVVPSYTGIAHGECDAATRVEIRGWLRNGYQAFWPLPPIWPHIEAPLQVNGIPFAEPTASALFWPVRTRDRGGREAAYQGVSGVTYGRSGRRFLADRAPDRYHVGVDLWGEEGDVIVACEDGELVNHYHFYHGVHALFVQCDSGLVINYGEVRENSWKDFDLGIGSRVQAGQPIALVGRMTNDSMCHFETYRKGTKANCRYYRGKKPPEALLNPTRYLLHLATMQYPETSRPVSDAVLPPPAPTPRASVVTGAEIVTSPPAQEPMRLDGLNFTELDRLHRAFPGGVRWRLTPQGIEVDVTGIERTPGEPKTVTKIWETFGDSINMWAAQHQVPCVLIVATIATESRGNPEAVREEPGFVSDEKTSDKVSPGLMQTLISTAREALNKPGIDRDWLLDPDNSIQAGTCYIAKQKKQTGYDPPKVACAYNAGSVRKNDGPENRWKMCQYPLGTGEHCDRFVKWFNDAVFVLANHSKKPSVPYDVYLA